MYVCRFPVLYRNLLFYRLRVKYVRSMPKYFTAPDINSTNRWNEFLSILTALFSENIKNNNR
jgi:hypothetical protein